MTRVEAWRLAEELALEWMHTHGAAAEYARADVRNMLMRALDCALSPSRIEAAERAVVEAAMTFDLRANQEREECGATRDMRVGDDSGTARFPLKCNLAAGHEGIHCGSTGEWRWT